LYTEAVARRNAWIRVEPHLSHAPHDPTLPPVETVKRPGPLPPGPVERYANRAGLASLAAGGVLLATTRDPRRATDAVVAGMPRAARAGREAFCAELTRVLSSRDAVVMDTQALRRLDRLDTLVLDGSVLTTGRSRLGTLVPVEPDIDLGHLAVAAANLFDPDEPGATRSSDGVSLGPVDRLGVEVPEEVRRRAHEEGRDAPLFGLLEGGRLVAIAPVLAELEPLAGSIIDAAHGAGLQVFIAGRSSGLARRIRCDGELAGGSSLPSTVRKLQAEGHGVMLATRHGHAALLAADCGVGLYDEPGPVPWGADVLCGTVDELWLLTVGVGSARGVSRGSSTLALYGSTAGALLGLSGPRQGSAGRILLGVNIAALGATAMGAWTGSALGRRPRPRAAGTTPWHALSVDSALGTLDTSIDGLSQHEAERRWGEQTKEEDRPAPPLVRAVLQELASPLTPVLATAAGISALTGSVIDAGLMTTLVGLDAMVGALQRGRADRSLRRLIDSSALTALVHRDGAEQVVLADRLVPGDVVELHAGDVVPADARVLNARGLEVDESSLTGESYLVTKLAEPSVADALADRHSMVFEGTTVAAGSGLAAVVATGDDTEVGRVASVRGPQKTSGVDRRLRALTSVTIPVALGSGGLLAAAGLLRGQSPRTTLSTGISLAVAAVPEGLPLVATIAELGAARRLSRRAALVRHGRAIEALGRVDVLAFDKTGTLTEGRISLQRVSDGIEDAAIDELEDQQRAVLRTALRATPPPTNHGTMPHPTDAAIVEGAAVAGVSRDDSSEWQTLDELPFEPARGYHAVLGLYGPSHRIAVKGAPETVLPRCDRWRGHGPLDEETSPQVDRAIEEAARNGLRVLAVAERATRAEHVTDERVGRLELLGFVALADTVRETARSAVDGLRRAGVDVVMLTGDHPTTAEAIAAELDLLDGRAAKTTTTGPQLEALDDAALDEMVERIGVFARVSPAQKVRIVESLQRRGRVVAVTGDGANDAPAIRLADVGIALGQHGTDAARDAADLVVTDDRIETIVHAIIEGRAMWSSVRDAISVLLGGNLGEILFTLGTGLFGRPALNARQILVVNLLTDLAPSLALALSPPRNSTPEALAREGPEASLGSALTRDVAIRAGATAGAAGLAWYAARMTGSAPRASSAALVALVGAQLGQTAVAGRGSPLVLGAAGASMLVLAAVVQVPGVAQAFGCRPLGPMGWGIGLGAAGVGTAAAWIAPRVLPAPAAAPMGG
jgi:cation-transporting ATPase I